MASTRSFLRSGQVFLPCLGDPDTKGEGTPPLGCGWPYNQPGSASSGSVAACYCYCYCYCCYYYCYYYYYYCYCYCYSYCRCNCRCCCCGVTCCCSKPSLSVISALPRQNFQAQGGMPQQLNVQAPRPHTPRQLLSRRSSSWSRSRRGSRHA